MVGWAPEARVVSRSEGHGHGGGENIRGFEQKKSCFGLGFKKSRKITTGSQDHTKKRKRKSPNHGRKRKHTTIITVRDRRSCSDGWHIIRITDASNITDASVLEVAT